MTNLYVITLKFSHEPKPFGNQRRRSWTSLRWIFYHLQMLKKSRKDLGAFDVHTIDLKSGLVTRCSAISFMSTLDREAEIEIKNTLGLNVDLPTLEHLYSKGSFNPEMAIRVKDYLKSKRIQ